VAEAAALNEGWRCAECGRNNFSGSLACSECSRLRHADDLKALSAMVRELETSGDSSGALAQWRKALALLPSDSKQHAQVEQRILELSRQVDGLSAQPGEPADDGKPRKKGLGGAMGAVGTALVIVLGKAKLLLLGLTKLSTLASMALFFGVYWKLFGWKFGAGLVASIYIHEMGHVAALRRFGIDAGAPMFIPGFGALVRLKQYPVEPREDARVGLAGPWWGLGAALAALGAGTALASPALMAIARTGGWINLFNLIPVWQLDGSRGMRALDRTQRVIVAAVAAASWFLTRENMLLLVLLGAVYRLFEKGQPEEGDRRTLIEFVVLVGALAAVSAIPTVGQPTL
jgi:Zn-dependent protease